MGFEPTTFCLEGRSSTTELRPHFAVQLCSDSQARLHSRACPACQAKSGGQRRIRTFEGLLRLIYSQVPLATWVSARESNVFGGSARLLSTLSFSTSRHANPFGPAWRSFASLVHAPGALTAS